MGFYTDNFRADDRDGQLFFDADVLAELLLRGVIAEKTADTTSGERIRLRRAVGGEVLAADAVVHREGRAGQRDDTKDVLILTPAQCVAMPDAVQARLFEHEQVQTTRNALNPGRRPGATRPPRGEVRVGGTR